MLLTRLHQLFTEPIDKTPRSRVFFWVSLSLTFAVIYSLPMLQEALESPYTVQDDARQHVFWMQRFLDPELFKTDVIADYFQSVAPGGYTIIYRLIAAIGIDPFLFNKVLPLILALITTVYCFVCTIQFLPLPSVGFIACLFLNQTLWMRDDLASGTPVAFVYPIFLAFLYYFLRDSRWGVGITTALIGLFYPQFLLICSGLLGFHLFSWQNGRFQLANSQKAYQMSGIGLGVALGLILFYALKTSPFGPVMQATEARTLWPSFFNPDPVEFWLCGRRSGLLPPEWCDATYKSSTGYWLTPPTLWGSLLLPLFLRSSAHFPLASRVNQKIVILPQLVLVSVAMFLMAHALLFQLHLPNRYSEHSLRIVTVLAGSLAFAIIFDKILSLGCQVEQQYPINRPSKRFKVFLTLGIVILLAVALIFYPRFLRFFPDLGYEIGKRPEIYEFLSRQSKDSLIVSTSPETDSLPSFTRRSILVGPGYAARYHKGYYAQMQQRAVDLVKAQYSSDLAEVKNFIQKYGVDFWLLEPAALTPQYLANSKWVKGFRPVPTESIALAQIQALTQMQQGRGPALSQIIDRCSVFQLKGFSILQTDCIIKVPVKSNSQ